MKTNKRVEKALEYIGKDSRVADIGCDHGYVLIQGCLEGKISRGIGVEVNQGPRRQALANILEAGLEDHLEVRLGSGLEPLAAGEVQTCVIAGMGGILIREILEKNPQKTASMKRLILQPMGGERSLREFLIAGGWTIVDEEVLVLDRLYLYIVAEPGAMRLVDDFLLDIGPVLATKGGTVNAGCRAYILENLERLERILVGMRRGRNPDEGRIREVEEKKMKWRSYLDL